jgi:hypothetical protein
MSQPLIDHEPESERFLSGLSSLSLLPNTNTLLVDTRNSNGPFLRLIDGRSLFDLRSAAPTIGYNASPLFGTIHLLENWLGIKVTAGNEAETLQISFQALLERMNHEPPEISQSAAEFHRRYIEAFIGQQYSDQADQLSENIAANINGIVEEFQDCLLEARSNGLTFSLKPNTPSQLQRLFESRLSHGLLFDHENQHFKFSLNLGFRSNHLDGFWKQLRAWLAGTAPLSVAKVDHSKVTSNYEFHQILLERKIAERASIPGPSELDAKDYLSRELERAMPDVNFEIQVLDGSNYRQFRQQILDMQAKVYEPERQTSAEEFDTLFDESKLSFKQGDEVSQRPPLAMIVLVNNQIVSMAFAGPLDLFPETRGAATDPHLGWPTTYYMLDLTVVETYRGSLGRLMKNALVLLASQTIVYAIHGRNRDRLARGMWAINLSQGSYQLQHLPNDYRDDEEFRDCIYYRCPLRWYFYQGKPRWSQGLESPADGLELNREFFIENMSTLVNGHHESVTTTPKFIKELDYFAGHWPKELRQIYATCNPQNAHQLAMKALRSSRTDSDKQKVLIATQDSELGPVIDCEIIWIANPCEAGKAQYLEQLGTALNDPSNECLAVFVEPILARTCDRLSAELLRQTKKLCRDAQAPIVFVESASIAYRYNEAFAASCIEGLLPDAVIANLGNSMSVILGRKEFQPRQFFHGGEPLGLFGFNELLRQIVSNKKEYVSALQHFDRVLHFLAGKNARVHVQRSIGWIEGELPNDIEDFFDASASGRYRVCPALGQILPMISTIDVNAG